MYFKVILWLLFFYSTMESPMENHPSQENGEQKLSDLNITNEENSPHKELIIKTFEGLNTSSELGYMRCKETEITIMVYYEKYYIMADDLPESVENSDPEFLAEHSKFKTNRTFYYEKILQLYGYSYNADNKTISTSLSNSTSIRMDLMEEWLWFLHTIEHCEVLNHFELQFWKILISEFTVLGGGLVRFVNVLGLVQYEAKTKRICEYDVSVEQGVIIQSQHCLEFSVCLMQDYREYNAYSIYLWKQIKEMGLHNEFQLEPNPEEMKPNPNDSLSSLFHKSLYPLYELIPTTKFRNLDI